MAALPDKSPMGIRRAQTWTELGGYAALRAKLCSDQKWLDDSIFLRHAQQQVTKKYGQAHDYMVLLACMNNFIDGKLDFQESDLLALLFVKRFVEEDCKDAVSAIFKSIASVEKSLGVCNKGALRVVTLCKDKTDDKFYFMQLRVICHMLFCIKNLLKQEDVTTVTTVAAAGGGGKCELVSFTDCLGDDEPEESGDDNICESFSAPEREEVRCAIVKVEQDIQCLCAIIKVISEGFSRIQKAKDA